jgi:hypothetical protein
MRKLAREAVIFMLLGAVGVLAYYGSIFPQRMYVEHGWVRDTWLFEFAPPQAVLPNVNFTVRSVADGVIDVVSTFFMELGWLPLIGFPAGLVAWALYRLLRFAIQG